MTDPAVLRKIYDKHLTISRPEWAQDEDLSAWQEDLIEIDAYYAGLVSNVIGRVEVKIEMETLKKLMNDFRSLNVTHPEDQTIYEQCKTQVESLFNLVSESIK